MSKKSQKALASATIMSLVLSTVAVVPAKAAVTTDPAVAGSGRVETSIAIAEKVYAGYTDSTTAVIANGADAHLVDSLAVAPLASQKKAPILLTLGTDKVEQSVIDELKKHASVKNIYLVGAVPASAKAQLEAEGYTVKVLQGTSRYETATAINKELGSYSKVAVVSGTGLADALSIASIAAKQGMAIELTDNNKNVPTDLDGKTVYTVGGTGVVTKDYGTRLAGANRLATNAAVVDAFKADLDFTKVYVANSANNHLVDALAGSVLAAQSSSPIVLVDTTANDDLEKVLTEKKSAVKNVIPLGGQVSTSALGEITAAIDGTQGNASDIKADSLKSVKAIASNKVEIAFNDGVTPDSNAGDYTIVGKGTTTAIKVSDAKLEGTKVVLTTDAMTAGNAYTLKVGEATANFTGVAKATAAPTLKKVECTDTERVKATFDEVMDSESALDVANYTIANVTVKSAKLSSDRKSVTLTTEGVAKNKQYTLKIANVKNSDGVVLKSASKQFTGKTDTSAPTIKSLKPVTNNRIEVTFSDVHGVDKASAETVANYAIKQGSDELKIDSVTAKDVDNDGYYETVDVVTDSQIVGKKYTLTINNLVDGSSAANKITKALTKDFYPKSVDKTAPTINTPVVKSSNVIEMKYNDDSALDVTSATNVDNYKITKNSDTIGIKKIEIVDSDDLYSTKGKTVRITTSDELEAKTYTITINNVADEFGNVISANKKISVTAGSKAVSDSAPSIVGLNSVSETKLEVTFDKSLDKAIAEDPTNYSFANASGDDVGNAVKAELDDDNDKKVTLTTNELTANAKYKLTVNNVADLSGNASSNSSINFLATRTTLDTDAPAIDYVEAVNKNDVRIHFDEPVKGTATVTLGMVNGTDNGETDLSPITASLLTDSDKVLVVRIPTNAPLSDAHSYVVKSIDGLTDKSNNKFKSPDPAKFEDMYKFSGTGIDNDIPTFDSAEQVAINKVKLHFSEDIAVDTVKVPKLPKAFNADVDDYKVDDDDSNALLITSKVAFKAGEYKVSDLLTAGVTDLTGAPIKTTSSDKVTLDLEDKDKPTLDSGEAVNSYKIILHYSEDIREGGQGSYKLTYVDDNNKTVPITATASVEDGNVVLTNLSKPLSSKNSYKVEALTGARDLANNQEEKNEEVDFPGSDVNANDVSITGIKLVNEKTVQIVVPSAYSDDSATTKYLVVTNTTDDVKSTPVEVVFDAGKTTSNEVTFETTTAGAFELVENKSYDFTLYKEAACSNEIGSYEVKGIGSDLNVDIDNTTNVGATTTDSSISFSGIDDGTSVEIYKIDSNKQIVNGVAGTDDEPVKVDKYSGGYLTISKVSGKDWFTEGSKVFVVVRDKDANKTIIYSGVVTIR